MTAEADNSPNEARVLLAGAGGYVGGRVLRALTAAGARVRCLARRPDLLAPRVGRLAEVVFADVRNAESLARAMAGAETAYYLVRLAGPPADLARQERDAGAHFASAARSAGVRRIIYLSRLGDDSPAPCVRTSHEVGRVLADGAAVIEFRAAPVIGSGSIAFELACALAGRRPIAFAPRWARTPFQPIAVEDLVDYLLAARHRNPRGHEIFEIGGPEPTSFCRLVRQCARSRRRRLVVPMPSAMRRLSIVWLSLATPLPRRLCRALVDSLQSPALVRAASAGAAFDVAPRGLEEALERALGGEGHGRAATHWSGAMGPAGDLRGGSGVRFGRRIVETHAAEAPCSGDQAFRFVRRLGGRFGWHNASRLWWFRGLIDRLIGGVGGRRGRPAGKDLRPGTVVDFWRVEAFEPGRLLLACEMRLPGRQWLEFAVEPTEAGAVIRLISTFDPAGLWGRAYWCLGHPIRRVVLEQMVRRLAALARKAGLAGRLEVIPADPSTWAVASDE